jgi:hypothetical protein
MCYRASAAKERIKRSLAKEVDDDVMEADEDALSEVTDDEEGFEGMEEGGDEEEAEDETAAEEPDSDLSQEPAVRVFDRLGIGWNGMLREEGGWWWEGVAQSLVAKRTQATSTRRTRRRR